MGVDIVQTDSIHFSSYFPPIAINRLLIRNVPVSQDEGSVLYKRINLQDELDLKYSQNSLSFNVSPLAYWGRERHRISFRLLNYSDDWVILLPDQPLAFSGLKPGNYTLQLRVSDENGIWSDVVREIAITVHPPFWLTGWAISGYIFLFLLVQFLIFNAYRRREARRKEAALLEMKINQEKELQAYKIEFFTNVAHEFRTPLTLISSHIHALIEDKKLTSENPRLLKVYNNSLKLQKLILEIMQFRKLEKGKEPLNIQETDPCSLIREVVSDLEQLAAQRNIHCTVEGCETPFSFRTDADKFQRIMTNLVSNAIKYNVEEGRVVVKVAKADSLLTVEVHDTGIGINPEQLPRLFEPFGISSAKKRGNYPDYRSTGLGLVVTKGLT
ncbi:MAG: ATP-binding protein, partial [Bacteroidales bacterium]